MKTFTKLLLCSLLTAALPAVSAFADPDNPKIDMDGYLKVAREAAAERQTHRVSEADFVRLSKEPGTIILDARSSEKFRLMHIDGAINLSFPDIDVESLKQTLPDKTARILIYCNNNFEGERIAFPSKIARASLNLSTYIALYSYGYHNVYELAPLIDVHATILPLVPRPAPVVQLDSRPSSSSPQVRLAQPAKLTLEPAAAPLPGAR